jgi:hypothetical protein
LANDRSKTPTLKTHGESPKAKHGAIDVPFQTGETAVEKPARNKRSGDLGDDDPTNIYDSGKYPNTPKATIPRPGEPDFVREAATPIKVMSRKTPGEMSSGAIPLRPDAPRPVHQVKMRAISEMAKPAPQLSLGYLAPPRDPNAVRARQWRDFVVWGSVCVILACVVALGIWFIAK